MAETVSSTQPSLLGLIVSEVEKLNETEKEKLLQQLRNSSVLNTVKALDAFKGTERSSAMTDEEADLFISEQRKASYARSGAQALGN